MKIRDRIKELRRVPASELLANPKNWRKHPTTQQKAIRTVLEEIGFAGACLAREDESGRLILIDGHLRSATAKKETVPVLVLDVTESEADKLLATFDPLAGMTELDADAFKALAESIDSTSESFDELLRSIGPLNSLDFPNAPESVQANVEELNEIKSQRKKANEGTADKNDTEKYLVIVFPSRQAREAELKRLGLPCDERYIAAGAVQLLSAKSSRAASGNRKLAAASSKHSGAGG